MSRAVIDQPGLKVTLVGLLVSIFLGLFVRSQITPNKVYRQVEQSFSSLMAANSSKHMKIEFDDAELKLSEWGWPAPIINISGIRISFDHIQCEENQIYIDRVQVPIKWAWLFKNKNIYPNLRFGLVEMRVNSPGNCIGSHPQDLVDKDIESSKDLSEPTVSDKKSVITSGYTEQDIFIDRLRIIDKNQYAYALNLQSVKLNLKYDGGKKIEIVNLRSQLYALKDSTTNYYKLKSDFYVYYDHNNKETSWLSLSGRLVNKDFMVKGSYVPKKEALVLDAQANELSLKLLLSSLPDIQEKYWRELQRLSSFAVSFKLNTQLSLRKSRFDELALSEFRLISNKSEINIPDFKVQTLHPFRLENLSVEIKKLDFDELYSHQELGSLRKTFSKLGVVTGRIDYSKINNRVVATGNVQDFHFTVKGKQAVTYQTVDRVDFHLDHKNDRSELIIKNAIVNTENVAGEARVEVEQGKVIKVQGQFEKIPVNPDVFKLIFTSIPPAPVRVDASFYKTRNTEGIDLSLEDYVSDKIKLKQFKVYYVDNDIDDTWEPIYRFNFKEMSLQKNILPDTSLHIVNALGVEGEELNIYNGSLVYSKTMLFGEMTPKFEGSFEYLQDQGQPDKTDVVIKSVGYQATDRTLRLIADIANKKASRKLSPKAKSGAKNKLEVEYNFNKRSYKVIQ